MAAGSPAQSHKLWLTPVRFRLPRLKGDSVSDDAKSLLLFTFKEQLPEHLREHFAKIGPAAAMKVMELAWNEFTEGELSDRGIAARDSVLSNRDEAERFIAGLLGMG
jgi:hypothetical protein